MPETFTCSALTRACCHAGGRSGVDLAGRGRASCLWHGIRALWDRKARCWTGALLGIIVLASRADAVDIVVVNNADSGNGTLRQAIDFNEALGGGNRILFSNIVTGVITLNNPLGQLVIGHDVEIVGPGANLLAIDGNQAHRVLLLTNNAAVRISGLSISGGIVTGSSGDGGGIQVRFGCTLYLSGCMIRGNSASQTGGGIVVFNTATATLVSCTIYGNSATVQGAGLEAVGNVFMTNCTVAGNLAAVNAGVDVSGGAIMNSTISGNIASSGVAGMHAAGALVRSTIIANNLAPSLPDAIGIVVSGGYNLIGATDGSIGWGGLDQTGTTNNLLNARLGPLQDNGGPTLTMAPLTGSPAIDQGNSSGLFSDQRGRHRPCTNIVSSIPFGGDHSDVGAFELNPMTLVVSNRNDAGAGSLRQTIQSVQATDQADGVSILFSSNAVGTIALTSGELAIGRSVEILGPQTRGVTVSGNNASRVVHVTGGSSVRLVNLTIANGNSPAQGAGIYNDFGCSLVLSNCTVSSNTSGDNGGGLSNNGSVAAQNSTFGLNQASYTGGGIYTYAGPVVLRNCTVVSNRTVLAHGGGVCNYSLVSGTSNYLCSTLVAANHGGAGHDDVIGVFTSGGYNLIGQIDYSTPGSGASAGVPTSGLVDAVNHDQVGTLASPINPWVGPLQDNGGPTATMALQEGSPAIDAGNGFGLGTDQRGAPRAFDFASMPNAAGGDGSDTGAFELGQPNLGMRRAGGSAVVSWPAHYGDFALQQNTNFPAAIWQTPTESVTDDGTNRYITVSPPAGNRFYRLLRH
jgi:parallel beta-helix repeat protein